MAGKLIIFKLDRWIKRSVVLAVWILSFVSFIAVTGNEELNRLHNETRDYAAELALPKNQTGALSCWRCDPEENGRLMHWVKLKNLRAENNNLGIFTTALHKAMEIDGLQVELYQYGSPAITGGSNPGVSSRPENAMVDPGVYSGPESAMAEVQSFVEQIARQLTNPMRGWRVKNIDFGNVSEVRVDDFDYKVFRDGGLSFVIQSSKATVSYKQSGILLRGRVTLRTADGSTLKSSHVRWEVEEQRFIARGIYVLDRGGVRTTGKGICVDAQLNRIGTVQAKLEYKEEQKWHAKL